jgi:hypothetical protein
MDHFVLESASGGDSLYFGAGYRRADQACMHGASCLDAVQPGVPLTLILLLDGRFNIVGRTVSSQQLRKVLRECRSRQDHVTTNFVRLLFQIALHV